MAVVTDPAPNAPYQQGEPRDTLTRAPDSGHEASPAPTALLRTAPGERLSQR
jgi:hypothetical protein